jgi:dihydroorotase
MHLSARESVDHLRRARARFGGGEYPAPPLPDGRGGAQRQHEDEPPLRPSDRAALIEALRDGTIAAVATDHAPHSAEEKDVPFEAAPFGVTGLETSFAALYSYLVLPGVLKLETLLERMSAGPARIFGLEPPRIAVGAPANLVLLDLDGRWRVKSDKFRLRSATRGCSASACTPASG